MVAKAKEEIDIYWQKKLSQKKYARHWKHQQELKITRHEMKTAWRNEENRQTEKEKCLFVENTRGDADKRLKTKLFLSLGKHGKKYFYQKQPRQQIMDIEFTDLLNLALDTSIEN